MRNTLSNSVCLVVRLNKITKDTDVTTRITNIIAPNRPGLVIINFIPKTLKLNSASPGVKALNNAGMAIKREKIGINIQVLFKKNPRGILEKYVSKRQNKYRQTKREILFITSPDIRNNAKDTALILGSINCKKPLCKACSSANIDSFRKDSADRTERSIKLLSNAKVNHPFLVNILPIRKTAITTITIPTIADTI